METDKAKVRQQILAGESDINTLSGFAATGRGQMNDQALNPQHPMYAYAAQGQGLGGMSNHDLLTPVNAPGGYSATPLAKMSLTSTSSRSMQRFFRRKGDGGAAFDDDTGADISDMVADMTFQDIAHIRGNGRYNTSSMQSLDTLPIIPIIGATNPGSTKNLNNIQYRKYMNHQKKMNYAQGARAMSLAGNNPMAMGGGADPRSMSLSGNPDARTMSIGGFPGGGAMSLTSNPGQMPGGPRTMSLNSNAMLRNQGQIPMNRPRNGIGMNMSTLPMGMKPGYPNQMQMNQGQMNQGQMNQMQMNQMQMNQMQMNQMQMNQMYMNQQHPQNMAPGGPRAQSLRGGNAYNQRFPAHNLRNNSLGGMGMAGPQGYHPMGSKTHSLTLSSASPSFNQVPNFASAPHSSLQPFGNNDMTAPRIPHQTSHSNSNDSLTNVAEEDEDKDSNQRRGIDPDESLPILEDTLREEEEEEDSEDFVYKFENDGNSPQLSRKSTVKKSNSMRVRRLDLFKSNNDTTHAKTLHEDEQFQVKRDRRLQNLQEVVTDLNEDRSTTQINDHQVAHADNQSFVASDKKLPDLPTSPDGSKTESTDSLTTAKSFTSDDHGLHKEPNLRKDSLDSKKRPIRLRSLAANTAFSNFRSPSSNSHSTFGLEIDGKASNEFEGPHIDHFSETESQSSNFSNETPKQSGTATLLVSPSSEHNSPLGISKKQQENTDNDYETFELRESTNDGVNQVHGNGNFHDVDDLNNIDSEGPVSHTESSRATSDTRVVFTPGRTPETQDWSGTSRLSNDERPFNTSTLGSLIERDDIATAVHRRTSAISRSNSELKIQGLLPSGGLIKGTDLNDKLVPKSVDLNETEKTDKRKSRPSSISTKSKSFIKRLSRSGSKKNIADDSEAEDAETVTIRLRVPSTVSLKDSRKPLVFNKEELAIMTCNNDLQNELQLVTSELAMSIKRELTLETQLRKGHLHMSASGSHSHEEELTEKAKMISELLEKLNNERRLRFISEEHAILSERGQSPSALKLDYEKNELYKQLLAKNDMVNQLQDRLDEFESTPSSGGNDRDLLHKYNDLLRENSELRSKLEANQAGEQRNGGSREALVRDEDSGYEQAQIMSLRTQRDELREMLTKLTSSQNMELKIAQDRIKTLEDKLQKVNSINHKLSKRIDRSDMSKELTFGTGKGGKLLGFDIVSPTKKLFD